MWIDNRIEELYADFLREGRALHDNRKPGTSDATIARKTGELYAKYQEQKDALLAIKGEMVAKALMEDGDAEKKYLS